MRMKVLALVAMLALSRGAKAAEYSALISRVEEGKITFSDLRGVSEHKQGVGITLPVAEKVKVVKGKFVKDTKRVEPGEEIKDGLKNEMFDIVKNNRMVAALIITDADGKKIIEIRVLPVKKSARRENNQSTEP